MCFCAGWYFCCMPHCIAALQSYGALVSGTLEFQSGPAPMRNALPPVPVTSQAANNRAVPLPLVSYRKYICSMEAFMP